MRAWNKRKRPKHWTKPKWHSQKPLEYFSLLVRSVKRLDADTMRCCNLKTNKSFRLKNQEKKHLADSMWKNKKYIIGDDK